LPPSMRTSPGSSSGAIFSSISSTGAPALIIIMMRRGRASFFTNSSRACAPTSFFPELSARNASVISGSRFHTATENPWSSTFRARSRPITARPIIPKPAGIVFLQKTSRRAIEKPYPVARDLHGDAARILRAPERRPHHRRLARAGHDDQARRRGPDRARRQAETDGRRLGRIAHHHHLPRAGGAAREPR